MVCRSADACLSYNNSCVLKGYKKNAYNYEISKSYQRILLACNVEYHWFYFLRILTLNSAIDRNF